LRGAVGAPAGSGLSPPVGKEDVVTDPWTLLIGLALVALVFVLVPVAGGAYLRLRGLRLLRCPETRMPAAVGLDAAYAAWTAAFRRPLLRVRSCTLWPRRAGCAQRCCHLPELAAEGEPLRPTAVR
jgi:hypothetical protein